MEDDEIFEGYREDDIEDGNPDQVSESEEEIESSFSEEEVSEDGETSAVGDETEGVEDLGEVSIGDVLAELSGIDGRLEAWETVENTPFFSRNISELNYAEGISLVVLCGVLFALVYWFVAGKGEF